MSNNKRKFLEGELKFTESKTSVKSVVKSLATDLVKNGWVDYRSQGTDAPWVFDANREIQLPDVIKKEEMKLFKILAKTSIEPCGETKGTIKVLKGITSSLDKAIQIKLNGKQYIVTMEMYDTPEIVASKLSTFIKTLNGFEETYIKEDNVTVVVQGDESVLELSTNYEMRDVISNDLVLFTELENGYKNGKIQILGNSMKSGDIQILINGQELEVPIAIGTEKMSIATEIKNKLIAETPFVHSYIDEDATIHIVGEEDVESLSANTDKNTITTTGSYVQSDNVGIIEVYSSALKSGLITIGLTDMSNDFQSVSVSVMKGDDSVTVANKIYSALSSYSYSTVNETVVTVANLKELQVSTDVSTPPITVTASSVGSINKFGKVEVVTGTTFSQNIDIVINGETETIPLFADMSSSEVAERILDYLKENPNDKYFYSKVEGDIVYIRGKESITSLVSSIGLTGNKPCFNSKILETGMFKGIINILQTTGVDTNLVLTINDNNLIVPLLQADTKEEIATKISSAIISSTNDDFLDTVVVDDVNIHIEGDASIETLRVGEVEVPSSNYEVNRDTIFGIGEGTNIGDNVLIKIIYTGEEFQRLPFSKVERSNGTIGYVAKLKSRPQGEVTIYKDTIHIVEGEKALNKGDNKTYHLGNSPISKSLKESHKLKVYKNDIEVNKGDYKVDYHSGIILFNLQNETSDVITVNYGVCSGIVGDKIPTNQYKIINDEIIDMTSDNDLKELDIIVFVNYSWKLTMPLKLEDINESTKSIILETEIDNSINKTRDYYKKYYVEIRHDKNSQENYLTGFEFRFGIKMSPMGNTLDENNCSEWVRTAWYDKSGFSKNGLKLFDWTPITYYMNFTQEYINIVFQGSPVVDSGKRDNYLISPILLGSLENYNKQKEKDIQYNFSLTGGGDTFAGQSSKKWGGRTGTGITDIIMERTGDGTPYQAHHTSFHTTPEFMDKLFVGGSYYTGSQHFSKIVVTHEVQRERGMFQSVLIGDRSAIFHLDELITNREDFNNEGLLINEKGSIFNECGQLNKSEEKKWVMFNINSPYWFANNSPNTFYGIALRKS